MSSYKENLIKFIDPDFKPRWEVFEYLVLNEFDTEKVWFDAGCGSNAFIREYKDKVKKAVGIDIAQPENNENFELSSIDNMPFQSNFANILTLRFVVEHLDNIEKNFSEIHRVLGDGGKVFCITTNLLCPFIQIAKYMPHGLKQFILSKIFKVKYEDIFPTYHKLNSQKSFFKLSKNFKIKNIIYISDLNTTRLYVLLIFLIWHIITIPKILNKFRANIIVELEKKS